MSDTKINYSLDDINTIFKTPIYYNHKTKQLNTSIISDLELIKTIDPDETSIYDNIFKPTNKCTNKVIEQIATNYTTDIKYLKQSQKLIKLFNKNTTELNTINNKYQINLDNILALWEEIKNDTGFKEKYLYIDWTFAKELNNNPSFLQIMSIYNIASPILSLCLPIFVLIIPFFIIKLKGIELTINQYINILKNLIANNSLVKMFTQFHEVDNGQKIYLLVSSAFYLFSIYQNILVCIRFYSNMQKIHNYIYHFKEYLSYTLNIMDYYSSITTKLTKYKEFNTTMNTHKTILYNLYNQLNIISPGLSFHKITQIGHIMHIFYQLYDNHIINSSILYSFGFNGYFNVISQISYHSQTNNLVKTLYTNKPSKPIFKKMFYPKYINDKNKIIKNDCNLYKNIIITGPNASGKTTTLKTTLINIILSQQIGYGCFQSLTLFPYDNIHCYLNIPDTSGRDSLFQAEARRCKDIIDSINKKHNQTHFCIFDELYSGTNPDEAVVSAFAFMDYIIKNNNVTCILTTHYYDLCEKLSNHKFITNYSMKTIQTQDNFEYTYCLEKGISQIKGGLKVLKDMDYPPELLVNIPTVNHQTK
jgi:hypothetical protein